MVIVLEIFSLIIYQIIKFYSLILCFLVFSVKYYNRMTIKLMDFISQSIQSLANIYGDVSDNLHPVKLKSQEGIRYDKLPDNLINKIEPLENIISAVEEFIIIIKLL